VGDFDPATGGGFSSGHPGIKGAWVKLTDSRNFTGWIHRDYIWIQ